MSMTELMPWLAGAFITGFGSGAVVVFLRRIRDAM